MSYPSPIHASDIRRDASSETATFVVQELEKPKQKEEETDIRDYGEFSGTYANAGKTDYISGRKKGYLR